MGGQFIASCKRAPQFLGNVVVLGLGKSGRAVVDYCLPLIGGRVASLSVAAGMPSQDAQTFAQKAKDKGALVAFGKDGVSRLSAAKGDEVFDLCVVSPGIPPFDSLYKEGLALSHELVGELEFAWRESDKSSIWVVITGTNGKTTVAACTAHLLKQAGMRAAAVGNIGHAAIETLSEVQPEVYVAEASSYQLASTKDFAPELAVLLNISPDHLHWHKTFEAYCEAKFKLIQNLLTNEKAVVVFDATNKVVRSKIRSLYANERAEGLFVPLPVGAAQGLRGDMRLVCGSEHAAFLDDQGELQVAYGKMQHDLGNAESLNIKGLHNVSNALMSAAVAVVLGVDDKIIVRGLASFPPLEHRIEFCGCVGGVQCYNDSKATNVDATITALDAFPGKEVTVLLGGMDKNTELASLVDHAQKNARAVVCFGAAKKRLFDAFQKACATEPPAFNLRQASCLEDAFSLALKLSRPGGIVLLSPACASFDEFTCFEQRGEAFKALVAFYAAQTKA